MKKRTTMVISVEIDTEVYDDVAGSVEEVMQIIVDATEATAPAGAVVEHSITTAVVEEVH